jgi:hypothetical protein
MNAEGQPQARWNDGAHIKLGRTDEQFLTELLQQMEQQLTDVSSQVKTIVAATHCVPFAELLPPPHGPNWQFIRAFLGSEKIGHLLQRFPKVKHVYCGHSHFPVETQIGPIHTINIGSGYRAKRFRVDQID